MSRFWIITLAVEALVMAYFIRRSNRAEEHGTAEDKTEAVIPLVLFGFVFAVFDLVSLAWRSLR